MAKPAHTKNITITPSRQGFGAIEKANASKFNRRLVEANV